MSKRKGTGAIRNVTEENLYRLRSTDLLLYGVAYTRYSLDLEGNLIAERVDPTTVRMEVTGE